VNRADPPDDVDPAALAIAVDRLVETFVREDKRTRARKMLLGGRPKKASKLGPGSQRREALQMMGSWIPRDWQRDLDRPAINTLVAKLGARPGVLIEPDHTYRRTVAEIVKHADEAVFIADDASLAIVLFDVGSPTLCTKPKRR